MSALWIAHVTVTNEEAYMNYAALATTAITGNGGEFIARGAPYVQLEGTERPRQVIARFASVEAAVACYNSPEYAEALTFSKGASERDVVVVEIDD